MLRSLVTSLFVLSSAASLALADEPPKHPWSDAAELGVVMTSGNSEGTNFALANKYKYTWSNAELTFDANALRTESRTRTITNPAPYGTPVVTDTTTVTAEVYGAAAKYRHTVKDNFFWYTGGAWYRNVFAGIDNRYLVGGGLGYKFVKTDKHLFKGELGADLTREEPVDLDSTDFVGARVYLGYEFKFSEKSKLTEDLNFIANLKTSNAWRGNSVTAITAGFTNSLALKLSYVVGYYNDPPIKLIPADPGPGPDATFQFEKTDTILTAALVINF